jgi:hypothetical protein
MVSRGQRSLQPEYKAITKNDLFEASKKIVRLSATTQKRHNFSHKKALKEALLEAFIDDKW